MSISPRIYDPGLLLQKISEREADHETDKLQKQCPNCRRGMYVTDHRTIQCENCELEEPPND